MENMEIEIVNAKNLKSYGKYKFWLNSTIADVRCVIHQQLGAPEPNRQLLRLQRNGRRLEDTETLESLQLIDGGKIYLRDLGPQIGYKTVFLAEYAGPLLIYLCFYIYSLRYIRSISLAVHIAALCNTLHYSKRLLETLFIHRFSHSTMPLRNLFKNCAYYWGFTAYIAWHLNHSLYKPPEMSRVWTGYLLFLLCEYGNCSVHVALRNLRAPGTKQRKIPMPNGNVFTNLFNLVSCPNYTYEIFAWVAFAVMTSCLPILLFAFVGAYQMAVWALIKHRNYKMEFKDYPKSRRAIFPYML